MPAAAPRRPLAVTADPALLDELLQVAATAGVELEVATDAGAARRSWASAPVVLVGDDVLSGVRGARLPRRSGVVLAGCGSMAEDLWEWGVRIGAEHVLLLPDGDQWLVDRLADATEAVGVEGVVVAVLGGRGGAGATTLAAALAVAATRAGRTALLVDGDPLGGGIDLVFGGEQDRGLRWPELAGTRGRLPAQALTSALPRMAGLAVLSWDRGESEPAPPDAVRAVLSAGRRANDLVAVDLPRALDDGARTALALATTVLLIVPTEVRAAAAAARVAAGAGLLCSDLRLVTRGPSPSGLTGDQVARALGLPLFGELRPEPGLDVTLERGEPPGRRARSPLAQLCGRLLDELLPPARRAA